MVDRRGIPAGVLDSSFAAIPGPRSLAGRPRSLQVGNAIPGHCRLPGLRPAAAPPGGRARARSGAQRSFRRITDGAIHSLDDRWATPSRVPQDIRRDGTGHPEPAAPKTPRNLRDSGNLDGAEPGLIRPGASRYSPGNQSGTRSRPAWLSTRTIPPGPAAARCLSGCRGWPRPPSPCCPSPDAGLPPRSVTRPTRRRLRPSPRGRSCRSHRS